ncbi:MAG TPA: carbohydrate-binding protein [Armatimonadota bacterium]
MRRYHAAPLFGTLSAVLALVVCGGALAAEVAVTTADQMFKDFFGGGLGAPTALFAAQGAKCPKCIGNFSGGAWVELPLNAPKAGWYKVTGVESAAVASSGDALITLDTRGKDSATHYVTSPILLPNTGAWQTWATTTSETLVPLRQGDNVLRVQNITKQLRRPDGVTDAADSFGGGVNLTWFEFTFQKDLEPLGTLTGTVTSSDLQVPVGFARVTTGTVVRPHDWWIKDWWTKADQDGKYALEVPAGSYTVTGFRADTYQPNKVTGVAVEAGKSVAAPEVKLQSNWKDGALKQLSRDVDAIITGGSTGFYDETWATPVEANENPDDTNIVTGWWEINDWTEQLVDVSETGWYKVQVQFSSPDAAPVTVRYDANGLFTQGPLDGSGSWRDYKVSDFLQGAVLLAKGTNRVRLTLIKGAFNESFHILTKTTGPKVGVLAGKVSRSDGQPLDAGIEVTTLSSDGTTGVARPGADGTYKVFSGVGTYTVSVPDVFGFQVGASHPNVQVTENQTTTAPDLVYTRIPFFLGVDPAKPASRPYDDDFSGSTLDPKWTSFNLGAEDQGDAQVKAGALTTLASQSDFWGLADNGHLTYQKVKGDFIAYVKLVSIPTFEEMGDWSKHGLMARINDSQGSPHFVVLAGSGRRTIVEWREEQDGPSASGSQPGETYKPGEWLKLVRKGGHFSAFWSYTDTGEGLQIAQPPDTNIAAFEAQPDILLALADTTGLSAAGTQAAATYDTLRVIPYDEAMSSLTPVTPPTVKGDVTGDGKLSIADVVLSLQIAAGLKTATAAQLAGGDFNKNGKIDISEVVTLLRAVAGIAALP